MKRIFTLMALFELGAGLALLCWPAAAVKLLLGASLEGWAALVVARVGGTALLTLGVACWMAHYDAESRGARRFLSAMVIYNLGAVVILGAAGLGSQPVGMALWAAVLLHLAMTVWSIATLVKRWKDAFPFHKR